MQLYLSSLHFAGFEGEPVMLANGIVVDSAVLPQNAVREHPVVVSADSLMASIQSDISHAQASLLASGGSLMDSTNLLGSQEQFMDDAIMTHSQTQSSTAPGQQSDSQQYPTTSTGQITASSGTQPSSQEATQVVGPSQTGIPSNAEPAVGMELDEQVEYHPILLSGVDAIQQQSQGLVEGKCWPSINSRRSSG